MSYNNLLDKQNHIHKLIKLINILKNEIEKKIEELQKLPNNDITKTDKIYEKSILHLYCMQELKALREAEIKEEGKMYQCLQNNTSEK